MSAPNWNEWDFWLKDPESVRNLAFTVGSIAAILGGAYGIILATVRSVAARRQSKAAEETQVTKLLIDAIGYLADKDKLELRLGAIYSLERIAQKSKFDKSRVLEILYAFLRDKTRRNKCESAGERGQVEPDIQACLDVILRNPPPKSLWRKRSARLSLADIDLRGVDLQGASLRQVVLPGANLSGANLSNADLRDANLSGAQFHGANLAKSTFDGANLTAANFSNSQLSESHFRSSMLEGAKFDGAKLRSAVFEKAKLRKAEFSGADLGQASFGGADLTQADFNNADLLGTDFRSLIETVGGVGGPGVPVAVETVFPTVLTETLFSDTDRELAKFDEEEKYPQLLPKMISAINHVLRWITQLTSL